MKKTRPVHADTSRTASGARGKGTQHGKDASGLQAVQARADASTGVTQLRQWQALADENTGNTGAVMQGMFRLEVEQGKKAVNKGKDTRFHRMDEGAHNFLEAPEDKSKPKLEAPSELPPLNVADDGHMAVEAKADVPKVMFMEAGDIEPTNEELKTAGSSYRLVNKSKTLTVPDLKNARHNLVATMPANLANGSHGTEMTGPQQCIEMAETVISARKGDAYREYLLDVATENLPMVNRESMGKTLAATVGAYAMAARRGEEKGEREKHAKTASIEANQVPKVPREVVDTVMIAVTMIDAKFETAAALTKKLNEYNSERGSLVLNASRPDGNTMNITIYDPALHDQKAYRELFATPRFNRLVKRSWLLKSQKIESVFTGPVSEPDETWKPKLKAAVAKKEDSLVDTIDQLSPKELEQALRDLGLNEYVKLKIGQAFGVTASTTSNSPKMDFPYHWAGVIAQRGSDVMTLENYARAEGATVDDDGRWYLQMYGPLTKVNISEEGELSNDTTVADDHWKTGTFHSKWKGDFSPKGAVPFTVGVGTKKTAEEK